MFHMKPGIDIEVYADTYEDFLADILDDPHAGAMLADFAALLRDDRLRDDTLQEEYNPDDYNLLPF